MKKNYELQKDVQNAIKVEPSINPAEIGVTAKEGVVALSGTVDSHSKKIKAEIAANNVPGVKAVVGDITIHQDDSFKRNDTDIAKDVIEAWRMNLEVPKDQIKVKVENGFVQLGGELLYDFQKEASQSALGNIIGIKGVINNITITSVSKDESDKSSDENVLGRSWPIDSYKLISFEWYWNKTGRLFGQRKDQ
jgi:osmotically-inducible protein OsmY